MNRAESDSQKSSAVANSRYQYPFSEFVRDLEAVRRPCPEGTKRDYVTDVLEIRDYMHETYSNDIDRLERGSAIATVCTYLSRHMELFNTGEFAVRGRSASLISDHLLRAVHWLVCPVAFSETDRSPTPEEVLALADSFAEHAREEQAANRHGVQ